MFVGDNCECSIMFFFVVQQHSERDSSYGGWDWISKCSNIISSVHIEMLKSMQKDIIISILGKLGFSHF